MTDNQSITIGKKTDVEQFSFSELQQATVDSHDDQFSIVQLWRVLQKRRWLVLGSLAAFVALATAVSLVLPKRYDASSRLLLDLEGSEDLGLDQVVMPIGIDLDTKLQTQIRIVQSDTIAVSVIKQLGLYRHQGFVGKQAVAPARDFDSLDLRTRAQLTNALHRSLNVQLIPKTEILEIHFRSGDPKLAADVANAVANTYIEHNFQTKYQATLQTSEWLTKQLDDVRKNAEGAQEKVISYQKKMGLLGTDESHNIIVDRLEQMNKALSEAEGDRIVKEAKYRIAMTENPELIANIAPESLLGALYKQRAESRSEYAQLAAKYGVAYPACHPTPISAERTGFQHRRGTGKDRRNLTNGISGGIEVGSRCSRQPSTKQKDEALQDERRCHPVRHHAPRSRIQPRPLRRAIEKAQGSRHYGRT